MIKLFKNFLKEHSVSFINELNHKIMIHIYNKKINGIDGVMICIIGPHSMSENHITLLEAKKLYNQLGKIL